MKYTYNRDFEIDYRVKLVNIARNFYRRGRMPGTAGNLSVRFQDNSFAIAKNNSYKSLLMPDDFIRIYPYENTHSQYPEIIVPPESKIHQTIYEIFPHAGACFQIYSPSANFISQYAKSEFLNLPFLDGIKGLGEISENVEFAIPIFPDILPSPETISQMEEILRSPRANVSAALFRNHSLITWGSSLESTQNLTMIIEYILNHIISAMRRRQGNYKDD